MHPPRRDQYRRPSSRPDCNSATKRRWRPPVPKKSYFRALYRRLIRTRGKNRALIAVAHSLLVTVYSFTMAGERYRDLRLDYFDKLNKQHLQQSLVKRLQKLGNRVTLEPKASAASCLGGF
jgi:transposase